MCKCNQENCNLEVFENTDKCILHCEKDKWDNSKGSINLFWSQIKNTLDSKYKDSFFDSSTMDELHIYDNVIFPEFQKDITYNKYEDNEERCGTNFYSYERFYYPDGDNREELNTIISSINISFRNCKFLDNAELSRYNFQKNIDFQNCEFYGDLKLNNTDIKGKLVFKKSFFHKKIDISNSNFSILNINDSFIYEIKTAYSVFNDISVFSNNIFYSDVYFEMNTFEKNVYFRNSIFLNKLNLRDTIFKEDKNFLGILFKLDIHKLNKMEFTDKNKMYIKNLEIKDNPILGDRETARIIKDSFEHKNNIIEANKFYALEMKEREKELEIDMKEGKNFFEWFIFKIHGLSSNHSQDWLLAFFWIFIIGFIASYYDFNLIQDNNGKFVHFEIISIFKMIGLVFIVLSITQICKIKDKLLNGMTFLISFYLVYIYATQDYLLNLFSKTINPFSVMKSNDPINVIQLFFKIIIAYLIYQLIISIRQNTRRK